MSSNQTSPKVTNDPRFRAGRSLMQKGKVAEAIGIFASLLEEARISFGEASVETAPAYYEYGNSLLRNAQSEEDNGDNATDDEHKLNSREAAALAAEKRQASNSNAAADDHGTEKDKDRKPAAKPKPGEESGVSASNGEEDDLASENDELSDVELALEMMETAWSILDNYIILSEKGSQQYLNWAQEQSPRYLIGIGDTLSALEKYADAADAYCRALEKRLELLKSFDPTEPTTAYLKCRRLIVEANILIAETFLACPQDEDVVTTETKDVLVKAGEVVEYARGYYNKARDELQEAVLLMGEMAAKGIDITDEKEDICFVSTMVMGVGESLAEFVEMTQEDSSTDPPKKKAKSS